MSPERLLQSFKRISEAPDAIPRLRRFVLKLAVRGLLVPQNPADGSSENLLTEARASLSNYGKEVRRGRWKDSVPVSRKEQPWEPPKGWAWARVNDTGHYVNGLAFKPSDWKDEGIPIIRIQNLTDPTKDFNYAQGEFPQDVMVHHGDLLVSWSATLDAFLWDRGDAVLNQHIFRVLPCDCIVDRLFLYWALKNAVREMQESEKAHGLVMTHINRGPFLAHPVAIPPLAEQHRIVAKVDELMALCDELEAAQATREDRRARLVAATLHGLNNGDTEPGTGTGLDFTQSARFYLNHLPRLTTRPEHVHQLRQTILNLAVRGKLVEQDPDDEPVTKLFERIDNERVKTAQEDRRAQEHLQEVFSPELYWRMPPSWGRRCLADVALFIDYRGKTPTKVASGIRLITAKNVRPGYISLEPEEFITPSTYKSWMTRGLPRVGDVLFTTEAPMGNAAVVELEEEFALAQRTICFRIYGGIEPEFFALQILSPPFQSVLDKTATGLTAKGIKAAKLKRLPFVLPPLAEQHRIVAKVDELMALCDELEAHLTTAATTRARLLDATLHEALNGAGDKAEAAMAD